MASFFAKLFGVGRMGSLENELAEIVRAAEASRQAWERLAAHSSEPLADPGKLDPGRPLDGDRAHEPRELERALDHARTALARIDHARADVARTHPVAQALVFLDDACRALDALTVGPRTRAPDLELAREFVRCGRCDRALARFERALSSEPDAVEVAAVAAEIGQLVATSVLRHQRAHDDDARSLAVRVLEWGRAWERTHAGDRTRALIVGGLAFDGNVAALERRLAEFAPDGPSERAWSVACDLAARTGDVERVLRAAAHLPDEEQVESAVFYAAQSAIGIGNYDLAQKLRLELPDQARRDELGLSLVLAITERGELARLDFELATIADPPSRTTAMEEVERARALQREFEAALATDSGVITLPGAAELLGERVKVHVIARHLDEARALAARIDLAPERAFARWSIVRELQRAGDHRAAEALAASVVSDAGLALASARAAELPLKLPACAAAVGGNAAAVRALWSSVGTSEQRDELLYAGCWWMAFERRIAGLDELFELAQGPESRSRVLLGAADGLLHDERVDGEPWPR